MSVITKYTTLQDKVTGSWIWLAHRSMDESENGKGPAKTNRISKVAEVGKAPVKMKGNLKVTWPSQA